jgi:Domain of unknown function (DUF222)
LPLTAASFGRGELSYSQVRAITRVATREIEDELLSVARNATGAQLEVLVRAYRGVLARDLEATNDAHRDRYLYYSHEDDGTLVLSGRIPAEEGALVLAALEAAGDACGPGFTATRGGRRFRGSVCGTRGEAGRRPRRDIGDHDGVGPQAGSRR